MDIHLRDQVFAKVQLLFNQLSIQAQLVVEQFGCDCTTSRKIVFRSSLSKAEFCILGGNALALTGKKVCFRNSAVAVREPVAMIEPKQVLLKSAVINGMNHDHMIEPHI